jgi:ribose transport system permease protein
VVLHRSVARDAYLFAIGKKRGGGPLLGHRHGRGSRSRLRHLLRPRRARRDPARDVHRSISPAVHGNFYELYAIAAGCSRGFSLPGRGGSILGVVLGTVLLKVLQNLVNLSASRAR